MIKVIVLVNGKNIISTIEEVGSELGEPDCKLIKPFLICEGNMLEQWLSDVTNADTFMISSDKILTLTDPRPTLLEKYESLIK
jgi:hypothetical protein